MDVREGVFERLEALDLAVDFYLPEVGCDLELRLAVQAEYLRVLLGDAGQNVRGDVFDLAALENCAVAFVNPNSSL